MIRSDPSYRGMIIIGYPGIGKSTIANQYVEIIDFESSFFNNSGKKVNDWYKIYISQAISLAEQGYIVCISSHEDVCFELSKYINDNPDHSFEVVTITPSLSLEKQWIGKLHERYLREKTDKNLRAFERASKYYISDIQTVTAYTDFHHIHITSMDYYLKFIVKNLSSMFNINTKRRINQGKGYLNYETR